jgi:hypothetical protein
VDTPDHTFVHMVEDLVDFSLTEIDQPLSFIPETPLVTPPTSTHSDIESFESEEVNPTQRTQIMGQTIWKITMKKSRR